MLLLDQKLRKEERLKSRKVIGELFEKGKAIHQFPFKVLYSCDILVNSDFSAKIGISVSKKNFKHAVDRNTIKRKIRESYRKHKNTFYQDLKGSDQNLNFFVIYISDSIVENNHIDEAMKLLLKKLTNK